MNVITLTYAISDNQENLVDNIVSDNFSATTDFLTIILCYLKPSCGGSNSDAGF